MVIFWGHCQLIPFGNHFRNDVPSVTWISSAVTGTDGSSWTTSALSCGAAASNRYLIAALAVSSVSGSNESHNIPDTVTIGGVSAVLLKSGTGPGGGTPNGLSFWVALVPTGTTAVVVSNYSSSRRRFGVGLYSVFNTRLNIADSGGVETTNATINISVNLIPGTIGLAITAVGDASSGTYPVTYSGITVTKHYDGVLENSTNHSGATFTSSGTLTITCTADDSRQVLWIALD